MPPGSWTASAVCGAGDGGGPRCSCTLPPDPHLPSILQQRRELLCFVQVSAAVRLHLDRDALRGVARDQVIADGGLEDRPQQAHEAPHGGRGEPAGGPLGVEEALDLLRGDARQRHAAEPGPQVIECPGEVRLTPLGEPVLASATGRPSLLEPARVRRPVAAHYELLERLAASAPHRAARPDEDEGGRCPSACGSSGRASAATALSEAPRAAGRSRWRRRRS